ncbi:MAG: hypothetical protein Q8937_08140 [Bacteroidota bacterium]|nr:hypothetical protein [Bacteroidota bacterium]MDP4258191.1 hypothetical protein [Bacteroidota bacterium]
MSIEMPIDEKIRPAVDILNDHGFVTIESCEGTEGHGYPEPTVRFEGTEFDLIRAYEVCAAYNLCVLEVKRVYRKCTSIYDKSGQKILGMGWEPPINEITFGWHIKTGTIFLPDYA